MKPVVNAAALYIHIPWCVRKCPYCDFNSHQLKQEIPETEYIAQLICDFEKDLPYISQRELSSIFFGGGTPSLLSPAAVAKTLMAIQQRIPFQADIEITLEANPGTVEQARFEGFRAAGVNRLSIGIQSFQPDKLQRLGRIHDRDAAIKAAEAAHQAGFKTFNLDLMFGLPEQTLTEALEDLKTAISLAPTHISWYQLTLEPNTLFYHQRPVLPQDDDIERMYFAGQELLASAGYQQYEVSAYAKPQHQCRHNINYWQFGDYIGIGAGAHGKITTKSANTITRTWKLKHPRDYLSAQNAFLAGKKIIAQEELPFEFMLNALRLWQPIPLTLFEERTQLNRDVLTKPLQIAQQKGLLQLDNDSIITTELGKRFLNDLIELFL